MSSLEQLKSLQRSPDPLAELKGGEWTGKEEEDREIGDHSQSDF